MSTAVELGTITTQISASPDRLRALGATTAAGN